MMLALLLLVSAEGADARRARIVARALSYEQNLRERSGETVRVLVAAKAGGEQTNCAAFYNEMSLLDGVRVQGMPLEVRQKTLASIEAVAVELKATPTHVLFICEGFDVPALIIHTRKLRVLTVGASRKHVEQGAAVGVEGQGDKMTLVVNRAAAKAEGASFADQLLRVASVID